MRRDGLRQRLAHDLRWRVGLLVFAVLGAVGSACAAWALHDMRLRSAHAASQDAGAMAQSVADCLGVTAAQVNVKAKTSEKLGPVGEERSMEARAVVLLFPA